MSDVLIKGMEMPEGCYYCPILIGKANCSCAITGTTIRIEKVREEMEDERLPDCPLVEHLDSSWQTGTPTEGGLYFVYDKYSGYGKRELNKDISMKHLEIAFHDVLAWKKIEPFKEAK